LRAETLTAAVLILSSLAEGVPSDSPRGEVIEISGLSTKTAEAFLSAVAFESIDTR
jgi:hypothetical protein